MIELSSIGEFGIWLRLISAVMFTGCLFFTLMYFEHLKKDEEREKKEARLFAVISLLLALVLPALYQMYIYYGM